MTYQRTTSSWSRRLYVYPWAPPLSSGVGTHMGGFRRVLLVLVAPCGSGCNTCRKEVYSQVISPNDEATAIHLHRECGATVGFNSQPTLVEQGGSLHPGQGNVAVFTGRESIRVERVFPLHVRVFVRPGEEASSASVEFDGVSVSYHVNGAL